MACSETVITLGFDPSILGSNPDEPVYWTSMQVVKACRL
mgnify:CR=1 FL=1